MAQILVNPIQSCSKGNCIALFDQESYLLLDFGINKKFFELFLQKENVSYKQIKGVLLTHSHNDHVQTIDNFYAKNFLFYGTVETKNIIEKQYLKTKSFNDFKIILENNKWTQVPNSNWKFKTFKTIHNCEGSICYLIKNNKKTLLYLTDTQFFNNKKFKGLTAYIIESNYGTSLLNNKSLESKHLNHTKNHLNISETEKLFYLNKTRKTKLFLFSHLCSINHKDEIISEVVKEMNNQKNNKVEINFIPANKILTKKYYF